VQEVKPHYLSPADVTVVQYDHADYVSSK